MKPVELGRNVGFVVFVASICAWWMLDPEAMRELKRLVDPFKPLITSGCLAVFVGALAIGYAEGREGRK